MDPVSLTHLLHCAIATHTCHTTFLTQPFSTSSCSLSAEITLLPLAHHPYLLYHCAQDLFLSIQGTRVVNICRPLSPHLGLLAVPLQLCPKSPQPRLQAASTLPPTHGPRRFTPLRSPRPPFLFLSLHLSHLCPQDAPTLPPGCHRSKLFPIFSFVPASPH